MEPIKDDEDLQTVEAIDNLINQKQQSYEEFLNCFSYFKKDTCDVQSSSKKGMDAGQTANCKLSSQIISRVKSGSSAEKTPETNELYEVDSFLDEDRHDNDDGLSKYAASFAKIKKHCMGRDEDEIVAACEKVKNQAKLQTQGNCTCQALTVESFVSRDDVESKPTSQRRSDLAGECSSLYTYPGQVEHLPPLSETKSSVQRLDFSMSLPPDQGCSSDTKKNDQIISTNEVQPFSLDENFDYDNMVLTPKFSVKDLEILKLK